MIKINYTKQGGIMTKIIYSFFVLSLLFSLYGCTGTNSSASQGVNLGNARVGMIDT